MVIHTIKVLFNININYSKLNNSRQIQNMNYSAKCQTGIKQQTKNVMMQVSGQSSVGKYKNKHKSNIGSVSTQQELL